MVQSGHVGSGAVLGQALGVGNIASGSLGTYDHASGCTVARAQAVAPLYSGLPWNQITAEIISGVRAVGYDQSGHIQIAMASVSGRMPAVGIIIDNVLSGISANVYTQGFFQFSSGLADYSGFLGRRVFVGRSGQLVTVSGANGAWLSGDFGQAMGNVTGSGSVLVNVSQVVFSGGPLGILNWMF